MEALEYAYRVYGSKSGRLPVLDIEKQRTNWERIAAVVADNRLSCQDMIELTEIFPDFAAIFRETLEAFVEKHGCVVSGGSGKSTAYPRTTDKGNPTDEKPENP